MFDAVGPSSVFGLFLIALIVIGVLTVLTGLFLLFSSKKGSSKKETADALSPEARILDQCQNLSNTLKAQKDAISSMESDMRSLKNEEFHLKENFEKASAKWTTELGDIKTMITKLEDSLRNLPKASHSSIDLTGSQKISLETLKSAVFTDESKSQEAPPPQAAAPAAPAPEAPKTESPKAAEAPKEEAKPESSTPSANDILALLQKKKS